MTRLERDMLQMFGDKLRLLLADCADTMERAGLDDYDTAAALMAPLLGEAMMGARCIGMGEDDALRMAALAYREAETVRKRRAKQRKLSS
jgi:hypothetical protein